MNIKEYFQPESCLYCLDKLNIFADISVGDNYVEKSGGKEGVSSLIIRSQKAVEIWERYHELFFSDRDNKEEFLKSQNMKMRKKNLAYAKLKSVPNELPSEIKDIKISDEIKEEYKEVLRKIRLGNTNVSYHTVQADIYLKNYPKGKGWKKSVKFVYKAIYTAIENRSFAYIKGLFKKEKDGI